MTSTISRIAPLLLGALATAPLAAQPPGPSTSESTTGEAPARPETPPVPEWRAAATAFDRDRIDGLDEAWDTALSEARRGGHARTLRDGGRLFRPDGAYAGPMPPAGLYACSVTKLGGEFLTYVAYPAFRCRISREADGLHLVKLTGSQRHVGRIYPDGPGRAVFLGTMLLGDDRIPKPYGSDPDADQAGVVERIGTARWRLVLPSPRFESKLDVLELVPVRR